MVIDIILLIIAFIGLIIASIADIKTREVPDILNYGLIFSASGIRLLDAIINNNWIILLYALFSFIAFYLIANLMYFSRQWGGGDAKLLMALAIIFPLYPSILLNYLSPNLNIFPFPMILFINILIIGSLYGLLYSLYLGLKQKSKFILAIKNISKDKSIKMIKYSTLFLAFLFLAVSIILNVTSLTLTIAAFTALIIFPYLFILVKSVEMISMYKIIPISRLTEGDWVADDIKIKGKKIYSKSSPGITKKQIAILKSLHMKELLVKEGIPFVPSFLLALIFSLIVGNPFPI